MEWTQFAIFLITVGGFFLANRSDINAYKAEAAADRRDMLTLMRSYESETRATIKAIEAEGREFRKSMAEEMKDFHGRLCAIS